MTIQRCSVDFSFTVCRYFQNCDLKFQKNEKGCSHPPPPSDFDGLPYPRLRFLIKMTEKDVNKIT